MGRCRADIVSTSKDRRDCPVAGKQIAAAECAESRHSRYACPEDCPHNTFSPANYVRLLQLIHKCNQLMFDWLVSYPVIADQLSREFRALQRAGNPDKAELVMMDWSYLRKDAGGRTALERLRDAGFPRMKNDHRMVHQFRSGLRPRLLEIRQIVDDRQMVAVDLLDPEAREILVFDRILASHTPRFATWLGYGSEMPHFTVLHGSLIEVRPIHDRGPREVLEIVLAHLGCPESEDERRRWFVTGLQKVRESLEATHRVRHQMGIRAMDARAYQSVYCHDLDVDTFADLLDAHPHLVECDHAPTEPECEDYEMVWDWLEPASQGKDVVELVGRLFVGPGRCRLDAIGEARIAMLKQGFEKLVGTRVTWESEEVMDMASRMSSDLSPGMEGKEVPLLLENPPRFGTAPLRISRGSQPAGGDDRDVRKVLLRAWLNASVPALDDKTPREAAHDPALRPRLVELVKEQVRDFDRANLNEGITGDMNWALRDLGLDEWIYPPPPPRPRPADEED